MRPPRRDGCDLARNLECYSCPEENGEAISPRLTLRSGSGHFGSLFRKIMQPTFRPHRKKRVRRIGFRARMSTRGGRKVLATRRRKGRKRLTVA